jgi:hypothetical protein
MLAAQYYDRRAKDNIQEVCFWQEKKLQRKTTEQESFTAGEEGNRAVSRMADTLQASKRIATL